MTALIGVDWGTTNLRAWRFGAAGAVLDVKRSSAGISAVGEGSHAAVLREFLGDWLDGTGRIILGGMVGSRNGWREIPYVECPATLDVLGASALSVDLDGRSAWIAPGLHCQTSDGVHDVMRGEEVQLLGAGLSAGAVILPGTHSKWARLDADRILDFRTFLTGELYALLRHHSFLSRSMANDRPDRAAFERGVDRALNDPAIAALLFSVRTEGLFDGIAPHALADYLSGLLIGAEIAHGLSAISGCVAVIADEELARRYADALARAGVAPLIIDGEAAASAGLWRLAAHIDFDGVD